MFLSIVVQNFSIAINSGHIFGHTTLLVSMPENFSAVYRSIQLFLSVSDVYDLKRLGRKRLSKCLHFSSQCQKYMCSLRYKILSYLINKTLLSHSLIPLIYLAFLNAVMFMTNAMIRAITTDHNAMKTSSHVSAMSAYSKDFQIRNQKPKWKNAKAQLIWCMQLRHP